MTKVLPYFLILITSLITYPVLARETGQDEYFKEKKEDKNIEDVSKNVEKLNDQVIQNVDSILTKPDDFLKQRLDSLNELPSKLQDKIQARIDSLKQKLDGNQADKAIGTAQKLTQKIDSLQNLLSNKLPELHPSKSFKKEERVLVA